MKRNNLFLTIVVLIATILISIFISIGNCQTTSQEEQQITNQQAPVQQSVPFEVIINKTNVSTVDDGTINSKIIFSNIVSGKVFVSLLDGNGVIIPGSLQKEARPFSDQKTFSHDMFIVPEGTYKLKITNNGDEFITEDIIIRGKNEQDAPTFEKKPIIEVKQQNTYDDTTGQFDNDAIIYSSAIINNDSAASINYVDVILYNDSNNIQTLRADKDGNNYSINFENLEPNNYRTEFVINYTNHLGDIEEAYSNSSYSIKTYQNIENPEAPIIDEVVVEELTNNNYKEPLVIDGKATISISILEKDLPVQKVFFTVGDQRIQAGQPSQDTTDPTRDLYQVEFGNLPNGRYDASVEVQYQGGRDFKYAQFEIYSENTPPTTVEDSQVLSIESLPNKDSGTIEVLLKIKTYNTIRPISDTSKIKETTTGEELSGVATLLKQEPSSGYEEVIKYVQLTFDEVPTGTYNFEYNVKFNDLSDISLTPTIPSIVVNEFGVDVPIYKSVEVNSTNNTWEDVDGIISSKVELDKEEQIEQYSIKFEAQHKIDGTTYTKTLNTPEDELFAEETIEDLKMGTYLVSVSISEVVDEESTSTNWNLILKEYKTLTEDPRAGPSILEIDYDIVKADYLETNGGIENIEVIFLDEDYFIDEVYFEIKSGESLIDSKQAENVDDKWVLPAEEESFTDLKPLDYNLSIRTTLLDSSQLEFTNLIKIEEKPNPEEMTDNKLLGIILGVCGGLLVVGLGFGYYYVRIK